MADTFTLDDLVSLLVDPCFYDGDSADIADTLLAKQQSLVPYLPHIAPGSMNSDIGTSDNFRFGFYMNLRPARWCRVSLRKPNQPESPQQLFNAFMGPFEYLNNGLGYSPNVIAHWLHDGDRLEVTYIYLGRAAGRAV